MSPKAETFFKRLFSTVILLAVLGGAVAWDSVYGYAALICLFCNMTTIEWYRMLYERREECCRWLVLLGGLVYPWALAGAVLFFCEAWLRLPEICPPMLLAPVAYTLVAFFVALYRMDRKHLPAQRALAGMGITLLAFVYPVWMFCFAFLLLQDHAPLLLFIIIITKLSDIWAYVCGVLLGRRFISSPFSPVVSPKKSWEGIIGSYILTGLSAALILSLGDHTISMTSFPPLLIFLVGYTILFILSVTGDLAGSLIKRGLGVKDSGSLLPGIGGIFDLIDSPAFTVSAIGGLICLFMVITNLLG